MAYFDHSKKENRYWIWSRFGGKCSYCGCDLNVNKFQVDHFDPLKRHDITYKSDFSKENCYPSCGQCNSSKSSFSIEQWRTELELKVERLNKFYSIYRVCKSFGLVSENPDGRIVFYFERFING